MAIISRIMNLTVPVQRFKAPKNTMYEITDIHSSITVAGNNAVIIVDYLLEDEIATLPAEPPGDNSIAIIATDIQGQFFDYTYGVPVKTKFISIARRGGNNFQATIHIVYRLIKASKTELILEWFRKGI